jgi:hypothetical protein
MGFFRSRWVTANASQNPEPLTVAGLHRAEQKTKLEARGSMRVRTGHTRKQLYLCVIAILICWTVVVSAPASNAKGVPLITEEKVKAMLGKPSVVVVDVRVAADRDNERFQIGGAIREDPGTIQKWYRKLPKKKTLIFYCA